MSFIASKPSYPWVSEILKFSRFLFREKCCVDIFHAAGSHSTYVQFCSFIVSHFANQLDGSVILKIVLNVTQKLIVGLDHATKFVAAGLHKAILRFLNCSSDMAVIQGSLDILGRLSDWSEDCRYELCASTVIDTCIQLIPEGDLLTQKLCVSLLRILCCMEQAVQQIVIYDGVPLLVGLLSIKNSRLQWHVAWCLAQLATNGETSFEIAQIGGISLVLAQLADITPPPRGQNDWLAMLIGVCALLAQLCQEDANQQLIVQNNGIYLLGRLLLLPKLFSKLSDNPSTLALQGSIFRVLRLIYSLERNRTYFKKIFTSSLFEKFVDIGHYVQDISVYQNLVISYNDYLNSISNSELPSLWEATNQRREPIGYVGEFELLEQLGSGAFGCVYTVRKKLKDRGAVPQYFALKEIFNVQMSENDNDKSYGDIISEVKIIKQQLRHPNIVRYRRIFVENNHLYIVMDLIEGVSLKEHITSIKEKRETFPEERVWNLIIQMVLALRYLHKDKHIVHRDLKPTNIMISDNDRVVITDFGLAKKKGTDYLKSAAGTIVYSCPEIVQNLPYSEKADIWSLGCCVYEMAALKPAFYSQNMLQLATHIVEGKYDPLSGYSNDLCNLIAKCLETNPKRRPDISEISCQIGPQLLVCLDDIFRIHASSNAGNKNQKDEREISSATPNLRKMSSLTSSSSFNAGTLSGSCSSMKKKSSQEKEKLSSAVFPPIFSIDKPVRRSNGKSHSAGQSGRGSAMTVSSSLPKIQQSTVATENMPQRNENWKSMRITSRALQKKKVQSLNTKRAWSSSSIDLRNKTEGVKVSSAALKPVADPVLRILDQIHQVIMVNSSTSAQSFNHKRRLIEQFKRKVFAKSSNPELIKFHFRKLAAEVPEEIDLDLGFTDFRPVLSDIHVSDYEIDRKLTKITYEQLASCLQLLFHGLPIYVCTNRYTLIIVHEYCQVMIDTQNLADGLRRHVPQIAILLAFLHQVLDHVQTMVDDLELCSEAVQKRIYI
ncbi:unnamed protein product [Auanema sp. JU1783]|nr:unnamed protein product [Auanema sp. JU1783]